MNTGTAISILNPDSISDDHWVPHFRTFGTTSKGGVLTTKLIMSQLFMIEFFRGVLYRTKLLGFNIPGKDLILGFILIGC